MTLLKRLQEEARKEYVWHSPEIGDYIQNLDHPDDINDLIANTVTAVLNEVENEARDLYLESYNENYQRALTDIKAIIGNLKRTEI